MEAVVALIGFIFAISFCLGPVILGTIIWVAIDSNAILSQIPRQERKKISGGAYSSFGWTLSCLLLWLIAFPWYLVARGKYKAYLQSAKSLAPAVPLASWHYCGHCGKPYQGEPSFCPNCGEKT